MNGEKLTPITNKPSLWALSPLLVFLCLYLVTSIIVNDFYKVPITVAFMASSVYAVCITKGLSLNERMLQYSIGAANKNIMLMIWIFILAGAFAQSAKDIGAIDATVNLTLLLLPDNLLLAGIFLAACFISLSIGTSVGTIVALAPVVAGIAEKTDMNLAFMTAIVVGGAFFGDNLSFISDTTIAACNTQGCQMRDKFRANFKIALPAAVVTLAVILVQSLSAGVDQIEIPDYNLLLLIPYVLVLIGGIAGLNVFVVLLVGIVAGIAIVLPTGTIDFMGLLGSMGSGASGMFETIMVTILVSAMCGLIREYGGFEALLAFIRRVFKGRVGGRLGVGLLVGAMDIATANNTVAIVMAGPIAKEISEEYGITPKESASLLDTFSCVFQGIIPYGAQMLIAVSTAGGAVSAFQIIPCLYYPYLLAAASIIYILVGAGKKKG